MNVTDLISELNDHGFTDTQTTRKMALINDTVWDVCSREPWPFLEGTTTLTFDGINSTPTNTPADFHQVIDAVDSQASMPLQPLRADYVEKTFMGPSFSAVGNPQGYYFDGDKLRFYPTPVASSTVWMRYLRLQPALGNSDLEAAILIPPRHHRVVILGTLWKLYDLEDDTELSARFEQHYENKLIQMRNDVWMKQYDRPDRIAVVDDDDFGYF